MIRTLLAMILIGSAVTVGVVVANTGTPPPPAAVRPMVPSPFRVACNTHDDDLAMLREHGGCLHDRARCDCLESIEEMCMLLQEVYRWR